MCKFGIKKELRLGGRFYYVIFGLYLIVSTTWRPSEDGLR
jgi:hypothetical protein